jgi:hypothetical protein
MTTGRLLAIYMDVVVKGALDTATVHAARVDRKLTQRV